MSEPIVTPLNYVVPTQQEYNPDDLLLIQSTQESTVFNPQIDYVEVFVYDLGGDLVDTDYRYGNYATNQDSTNNVLNQYVLNNIRINPVSDLESYLLDTGAYVINYNFYRAFFSSSVDSPFYVKEISPNRTELRLSTNYLSNDELATLAAEFSSSRFDRLIDDFYLNFGDNNVLIATNFLLDNTTQDYTLLVKLYEPLPERFGVKSQTWVVDKISNDASYQVEFVFEPTTIDNQFQLKGPNTNLNLKDQINNSTIYQDYNSIISSSLTSSQQQYFSILEEKAIDINIDFSDYSNFVHFSSAKTRLDNFYYKVEKIESYTNDLSTLSVLTTNSSVSSSKAIIQSNINSIIENFDEYEYYLYYNSSSYAWPKSTPTKPYILYSTGSTEVLNWFGSDDVTSPYYGGQIYSASVYDEDNQNNLYYSIPEYIRTNPDNVQYELFIAMIGQLFDNIWVYYKDVTNKYNADNRLDFGVSKDLIAEVIRDLGIKIYQNNFSSQDVFSSLLGINPNGGLLPMTGSELVTTYVTSSNEMIPLDNIEKSIYKRIYHNLPYLLKTKGTTTGLQTLISLYGVEDTILRVAEFGGKDKNNVNDWDYWKDQFNYVYTTNDDGNISTDWILNTEWKSNNPKSLQFRFKTSGVDGAIANPSQSLWSLDDAQEVFLVLEYNGTGYTSGSYSGSIVDPYNQYATLKFFPDGDTVSDPSASVYLPFFDGGWWSVMVTVDQITSDPATYTLYASNNIYNGDDGSTIGFEASSSITASMTHGNSWSTSGNSYFPSNNRNNIGNYTPFVGSYQEIRYYSTTLSQSVFSDFVMNPNSIEGNSLNSSPDELAFRASLGGELYTGSISIHPKVSGPWITTSSFTSDSNITIINGEFSNNTETIYLDQPAAGIKNIVSNKIQILDTVLPSGDTLSALRSIQQNVPASSSYTPNITYAEVAFSPQNEINDDIMDSLGYFNMGDYIGDPRQRFNQLDIYPSLDNLRNSYFDKYTSNYDWNDYIRLIKYFNNSLFKMIQDFTPARTSLASGVVIKQHLLERNKYPQPEVTSSLNDFSGSLDIASISGSAGGVFNQYNGLTNNWGVTQSWTEYIINPYGVDVVTHSSQDEFYNGELSGSILQVENGELNEANPFKQVSSVVPLFTVGNNADEGGLGNYGEITSATSGYITIQAILNNPTEAVIHYVVVSTTTSNGKDISVALSNLRIGDTISFQATGDVILGADYNFNFIITTIQVINGGYKFGYFGYPYDPTVDGNPIGTNSLLTLTPFINVANFNNSDYNAVINNALIDRYSSYYQEVDYSTNQLTPVNFAQLISGSAYPASVQDSNYTTTRVINPRYVGSKNTTDNVNNPNTSQVLSIQNSQNVELGPTLLGYPSVSDGVQLGLYYYWAGGADPELPGKTAFQIKFMFDQYGNVFEPNVSSSYYYDLLYAFEQNSQVNVIPYNPQNSNTQALNPAQQSIQGIKTVFWPGVYFNAYLTTQSGSTVNNGFQSGSLLSENINQSNVNTFTLGEATFGYWFTTSSLIGGDTLLASPDLSALTSINFDNTVNTLNTNKDSSLVYYQITGSTPSNREGFDKTSIPIMSSPYIYNDDFTPPVNTFTGSFTTFPDLVRIQKTNDFTAEYEYYNIVHCSASYGTTTQIKLDKTLDLGYATSNGRVNRITFLRLAPSPEKLYLNVNKVSGDTGPGFILPAYPSSQLTANLPDIIKLLSEKNLL